MRTIAAAICVLLVSGSAWAGPAFAQSSKTEAVPDSQTVSKDAAANDALAGPRSVQQTLRSGDALTSPQFRSPGLKDVFPKWFALKERLEQKHHLKVGWDYTAVAALSTSDLGEGRAISHDLRFYGTWTPVNPDGPNSGSLTVKVENRNAFTPIAPQDLGLDGGAAAITYAQFSDPGWVLTNLYWKQRLYHDRVTVGFGQVDVTDYTDLFPLANPVWGFMNLAFSISPAVPVPRQGLGAAVGVWFPEHTYLIAGIADANGDPALPFRNVFRNGETFQAAEIGYTSSRDRQFLDNLHLTVWSQDERAVQGLPSDWGLSASAAWGFHHNTWWPFLRAGWSERGTALAKESVSAGFGHLTRRQDLFGLGLNWARPGGDTDENSQWILETFYKYQASETTALTLDLQQVLHPALNPEQNLIGFYALRLRVVF